MLPRIDSDTSSLISVYGMPRPSRPSVTASTLPTTIALASLSRSTKFVFLTDRAMARDPTSADSAIVLMIARAPAQERSLFIAFTRPLGSFVAVGLDLGAAGVPSGARSLSVKAQEVYFAGPGGAIGGYPEEPRGDHRGGLRSFLAAGIPSLFRGFPPMVRGSKRRDISRARSDFLSRLRRR